MKKHLSGKLSLFFLVIINLIITLSCTMNIKELNNISFKIPDVYRVGECEDATSSELEQSKFLVELFSESGKVLHSGNYKAGEVVCIKNLLAGNYKIVVTGDRDSFIYRGESDVKVRAGIGTDVFITLNKYKKEGRISIDFTRLQLSHDTLIKLKISSNENSFVYEEDISANNIKDGIYLIDKLFEVGKYHISLVSDNEDEILIANQGNLLEITDEKTKNCTVVAKPGSSYYVCESGNDELGTGAEKMPYRTVSKVMAEVKENQHVQIFVKGKITETKPLLFNKNNVSFIRNSDLASSENIEIIVPDGIVVENNIMNIGDGVIVNGDVVVNNGGVIELAGSGKIDNKKIVTLNQGASIDIKENLSEDGINEFAAVVKIDNGIINTTPTLFKSDSRDTLKNNCGKFKIHQSQDNYEINSTDGTIVLRKMSISEATALINDYPDGDKNIILGILNDNNFGELNTAISNSIGNINLELAPMNQDVKNVSLPSRAFASCAKLTSIKIPSCVTSMGNSIFINCKNLTITYEDNNQWYGQYCVGEHSGLVDLSDSFKLTHGNPEIGEYKDYDLYKLASPADVQNILNDARPDEELTLRIYAANVGEITDIVDKINNSNVQSVNIIFGYSFPEIKKLGTYFSNNQKIKSFKLLGTFNGRFLEGINTIESGAFENCSNLVKVDLESSVTTIGANAFAGCTSLQNVTFQPFTYPDSLSYLPWRISDKELLRPKKVDMSVVVEKLTKTNSNYQWEKYLPIDKAEALVLNHKNNMGNEELNVNLYSETTTSRKDNDFLNFLNNNILNIVEFQVNFGFEYSDELQVISEIEFFMGESFPAIKTFIVPANIKTIFWEDFTDWTNLSKVVIMTPEIWNIGSEGQTFDPSLEELTTERMKQAINNKETWNRN